MPRKSLKVGSIRQTVFVKADPVEVYEALVDPGKHSEFTGSPASGSRRVGGLFTAWDGYITAKNIELEKGKRIVQDWKTSEWPEGYPPSRLEITLAAKKNGTQLTMNQSRVPAEQVEKYRGGWVESYWDPLKEYFSGKKP